MKKNMYLVIIFITLIGNLSVKASTYLYLQNEAGRPIQYQVNNLGQWNPVELGGRKTIAADHLQSLDARYSDGHIARKLDLGDAIEAAQKEGVSSIIYVVPGTLYGVKVGSIKKVYDNILIPVKAKMEVLRPLELTLVDVDVPKFSKIIAAKILGIAASSTHQQAEAVYLEKARTRDRDVSEDANDYRGYLLTKALRSF